MFGHKWEPAAGTVAECRYDHGSARTPGEERVYIMDVRLPSGTARRPEIRALSSMHAELPPGTVVRLELNAKTGELRFDQHHPVEDTPKVRDTGQALQAGGSEPAAAVEKIGQIKSDVIAGSDRQPVMPGQPETPGAGFSSPAMSSPPTLPTAPTVSSPATFGSLGAGPLGAGPLGGQDDKAERIERLAQQRDSGQLTEQQFAEQRQRILDEF